MNIPKRRTENCVDVVYGIIEKELNIDPENIQFHVVQQIGKPRKATDANPWPMQIHDQHLYSKKPVEKIWKVWKRLHHVGLCRGYTTGAKSSYKSDVSSQIYLPSLKWSILNSHPHSLARSKQATIEAILDGTEKLKFSGTVQVHEHSLSKCHLEVKPFWQKKKAEMEKTCFPTVKSQQVKSKPIYNSFKKTENPLN